MSDAIRNEEQIYTYKDYKDWPEDERYEIINGEAFMMSAPDIAHQDFIFTMAERLKAFFKDKKCKVLVAPVDVRLFYREDESDTTIVQPDIIVVCGEDKLKNGRFCKGPPDLVVEALSKSTLTFDTRVKFELYKEAGVKEYWIADYKNEQIIQYTFGEKDTWKVADSKNPTICSDLYPGLSINTDRIWEEIR